MYQNRPESAHLGVREIIPQRELLMGVLAKKNMLRILALSLGVLSFVLVSIVTNEQKGICDGGIGFF